MTGPPIEEAAERSADLLERAATRHGFVASPAFDHYSVIWARDGAISSLGALASGESRLIEAAVRTMQTLGDAITPQGQIPAVFRPESGGSDWGEGGVVDATAWFVILTGAVHEVVGDAQLIEDRWPAIANAMSWLRHQDVTGSELVSAAPGTDWMDSSLVRSGRTLGLNVLYRWAARCAEKLAGTLGERAPLDGDDLSRRVNTLFWPSADAGPETLLTGPGPTLDDFPHSATVRAHRAATRRERNHYVSHVIHAAYDEHCDVLANLLATCTEVADDHKAHRILDHLDTGKADLPYPSRSWVEPLDTSRPSSMFVPGVEQHLDSRWHNPPNSYHNGGVWPFIGGFHVTALALRDRTDEAHEMIERLAMANAQAEWGFHEWLHGESGEPHGARDQTWNAGTFLLAAASLRDTDSVRRLFV